MDELYGALFDLTTEGILIHNKGIIINLNKPFADILCHKSHKSLIGKSVFDLNLPDESKNIILENSQIRSALFELEAFKPNGTIIYFECRSEKIKHKKDELEIVFFKDITASKIKLTESENRYKLALNASSDGVFDWNVDTNEVYYSSGWKKMLGYDQEELENKFSVWERLTEPEGVERTMKAIDEHFSNQTSGFESEFRMKHKNGSWVDILSRGRAVFDKNGKAIRLVGTHIDLTEKKKMQKDIQKIQMHYSSFINASTDSVSYWKMPENLNIDHPLEKQIDMLYEARCVDANNSFLNIFGFNKKEEVIGQKYMDILAEKKADKIFTEFIKNQYKIENYEHFEVISETEIFYGIYTYYGIVENGKLINLWSSVKDITKEKKTQLSLKESRERYNWFLNNNYDGIAMFEFNNPMPVNLPIGEQINYTLNNLYVADCNYQYAKMYGFKNKEEILGLMLKDLWGSNETSSVIVKAWIDNQYQWRDFIEKEQIQTGEERWFRNNLITNIENEKIKWLWVVQSDITDEKIAINNLIESKERFKKLSELTFEGIIIHENGICIDVNSSFCKLTGYSRNEIIGKNIIELCIPEKYLKIVYSKIRTKSIEPYEIKVIRKNKSLFQALIEGKNLDNKQRVVSVRDITELKETEKRIMNAIIEAEEKERERFSRELHDGLGPILSSLKMYNDLLKSNINDKERNELFKYSEETLEEALDNVDSISNNISPRTLNAFGVSEAVKTFTKRLKHLEGISIDFTSNFTERFDKNLEANIYRILTELINNTIKHANATNINITIEYKKNENQLVIFYSDNGKGFDFNKIIKEHKGLGLINIQQRIKSFNGTFSFTSEPGGGFILLSIFDNIKSV